MKLKFWQTTHLEVCYHLGSFTAEVKIFRFWPKAMDYSPWFDFWESDKSLEKSIPPCSILGYQDTGYMVETQGEYPGTLWYRPSIPGILGYQDTGYMVEPQGEYPGTVWYRPSIPGILGYQDTGYMVEPQGEYPGTVWYRPSIPGILGY